MTGSYTKRPVVAILTKPKEARALSRQEPPYDYIKYAEAAKDRGIPLYCFCANDMDLKTGTVQGWSMDVAGNWVYQDVPWPDFVYNMAKGKAGKTKKAKAIKADKRLNWLNEIRSHPKWRTHRVLRDEFNWLLPETIRGRQPEDLRRILKRYQAVMTKPDKGTWGSGICRIWREADGSCSLRSSYGDHETKLSVEDAFSSAQHIARGRSLIIQQALNLLKIESGVADLRLMMGRDRLGQWQVVQWYIRIGKPGSLVSNWHRGGSYMDVVPGLVAAGLARQRANELFSAACRAAVQVAGCLEQAYSGHMAELGLDFAFDTDLRMWLIEANGWPNKGHVEHETDPIPKVYSCIIDYALSLWKRQRDH